MVFSLDFLFNSILFGVGLAMDAFSVSIANGIRVQDSAGSAKIQIAGVLEGYLPKKLPFAVEPFLSLSV